MDKQKQIEEMHQILLSAGYDWWKTAPNGKTKSEYEAECFYNAGYRKIPENAVVLTDDEYERWQGQTLNIKKVRKETAEKIDDYLVKRINENFEKLKKEQELPVIRDAILRGMLYVRNAEREICKEFTEGKE
jgi:hypothetical protein